MPVSLSLGSSSFPQQSCQTNVVWNLFFASIGPQSQGGHFTIQFDDLRPERFQLLGREPGTQVDLAVEFAWKTWVGNQRVLPTGSNTRLPASSSQILYSGPSSVCTCMHGSSLEYHPQLNPGGTLRMITGMPPGSSRQFLSFAFSTTLTMDVSLTRF